MEDISEIKDMSCKTAFQAASFPCRKVHPMLQSIPAWSNSSDTLTVNLTAPALPLNLELEEAQGGQKLSQDSVPDLVPAKLMRYKPLNMSVEPILEWTKNCWIPLGRSRQVPGWHKHPSRAASMSVWQLGETSRKSVLRLCVCQGSQRLGVIREAMVLAFQHWLHQAW